MEVSIIYFSMKPTSYASQFGFVEAGFRAGFDGCYSGRSQKREVSCNKEKFGPSGRIINLI